MVIELAPGGEGKKEMREVRERRWEVFVCKLAEEEEEKG